MDSGEKELRKVFEEVTTGNVKTTIAFSQETRKLFRALEEKVTRLENEIYSQKAQAEQFKIQLASLQTKVYSGGTA